MKTFTLLVLRPRGGGLSLGTRRARRLVVKDQRQPSFLSRRARGRLRNFNSKLRLLAASFWDDR